MGTSDDAAFEALPPRGLRKWIDEPMRHQAPAWWKSSPARAWIKAKVWWPTAIVAFVLSAFPWPIGQFTVDLPVGTAHLLGPVALATTLAVFWFTNHRRFRQ